MSDSVTPWTLARQAPLSMRFSRQEYWSGLLCPPPGTLPNPGIKPASLLSPVLAGGLFTAPPRKPSNTHTHIHQFLPKQWFLLSSRWGWLGIASAAGCPQGPVCGMTGSNPGAHIDAALHAHWGGSEGRKLQGSLKMTGQRGSLASFPGPAESFPRPQGRACILDLWDAAALAALWEKDGQQHNQEDEQGTAHCQPHVDPAPGILPALLLGQSLGCLAEG